MLFYCLLYCLFFFLSMDFHLFPDISFFLFFSSIISLLFMPVCIYFTLDWLSYFDIIPLLLTPNLFPLPWLSTFLFLTLAPLFLLTFLFLAFIWISFFFSAPAKLVSTASECRWSDAVVELQVWCQLAASCHRANDHSSVLRCTLSALQLEEAAAKSLNTTPCVL